MGIRVGWCIVILYAFLSLFEHTCDFQRPIVPSEEPLHTVDSASVNALMLFNFPSPLLISFPLYINKSEKC